MLCFRMPMPHWTERINFSASFVTLAEATGLWPVVCGTALAIIEYVVSRIYSAPPWVIVPASIFTFGATIWTFNQAAIYRRRIAEATPQKTPGYEEWDRFNELTVWDAACLWDEKPLNSPMLSDRGLAIMRRIKRAINKRQIPGTPLTEHGHAYRHTMVPRDALKALAGTWNEKPPFLYPERRIRPDSDSNDSSLDGYVNS